MDGKSKKDKLRTAWSFIKIYYKEIFLFIGLLLAYFVARFLFSLFFDIVSINLLFLSIVYVLWLLVIYFYLVSEKNEWINRYQGILTLVGIMVPVILFLAQEAHNDLDVFKKNDAVLSEENNRNISHLQSIVNDLKNDPMTIFWRDFYLDSYRQSWDYISWNYNQECKNLYAEATIRLGILNNMNQVRRNLILASPNKYYEYLFVKNSSEMLGVASSTLPIFYDIIQKCQ